MFRLIKLAMYGLVGYVLYELYQGMVAGQEQGGGMQRASGGQRLDGGERQQAFTGSGEGRIEQTLDRDGGSVPHRVGRGVRSV